MNYPLQTEKRIIRVFPQRTSYTPDDGYVRIGSPDMFDRMELPPHDEIHVSCTFTWDKERCEQLQDEWQSCTRASVLLGGPAYGSRADDFVQGLYMKSNIIFRQGAVTIPARGAAFQGSKESFASCRLYRAM